MSAVSPAQDAASGGWIVLKFGGTSVSRRHRWDTIGRLAKKRADETGGRVVVVVSALSGVTNELTAITDGAADTAQRMDALERRHREFLAELELDADAVLGERLAALRALLADPRAASRPLDWQAEVLGQGELLSSTLGAAYLRAQGLDFGWMDARDWLDALPPQPNQSEWSRRLSVNCRWEADDGWRERFAAQPARMLITQGFIARHQDGGTAVLGRGGSDTSAAYLGALLGARRVEIWTDVPGMFSANPREVPDARLLSRLGYAEAQEITTTGAKVLHPRSIKPCRDSGVPMAVLDTENPDLFGTVIDRSAATVPGVKAISRRNGVVLVSVEDIGMWQQVGYLADVFELFRTHGLSVDMIGTSQTNVTVSLDPSENLLSQDVLSALAQDLQKIGRVKVIVPCAAITLVGRGMRSLLHRLPEVFSRFGHERVHMISQSSNDLNLTFVIDEADADGLLPQLHAALIDNGAMPVQEAEVFGPRWREINGAVRPRPRPWWRGERRRLLDLARAGTPRYVYHLPTVRERARQLKAVAAVDHRYYAIKANPHPAILRALVDEGFGLECVSLGELRHAFAALPHLDPKRVLFTPSFAPREEYEQAFALGATVTVDNVELLQRWPETFRGRSLWLRIDLGHGDGHHEKVNTGGKAAKFGLSAARVDEFVERARTLGVAIAGLHAHLGSGVETAGHWRLMCDELAGFARRIGSVGILDIGGGLPIPYSADDEPFDLEAWAAGLAEVRQVHPAFELAIEPGRFLVAEAGVLLARATQVVEKDGVLRVGLDAGMNALLRPALYDAWHDIVNLSRLDEADEGMFDVVGPICESSDIFGRRRRLPAATAPDDAMLVADAGAYGQAMASTYNQRALPVEDVLDGAAG
ncbi:diaminopimelate decarboxylase [Pseudoxanthomonas broegbernensis]|uniref:aspartate kinase n=1 Tax=Pseudoxanthomonas broegbernensis TaxID=83619 RepID=A0A7V8GM54_9GAMM|nr:bifunctional aspartate kinase/diaminopimelate decarboxylase [Pseudoxanthomonas broegbernensis]KAF1686191.1 diaminopimelate decarboxylase [Pseudoxanthomonas broegbernensis]MBB6063815.1 diaminopimelate decarboxylase/aspartate kinase [Pseudoxanthomonas broegbernensis]